MRNDAQQQTLSFYTTYYCFSVFYVFSSHYYRTIYTQYLAIPVRSIKLFSCAVKQYLYLKDRPSLRQSHMAACHAWPSALCSVCCGSRRLSQIAVTAGLATLW